MSYPESKIIKNRLSIWVTIIYLGILFIVAFFGIRELNHINNIKENTIILNKKYQQLSSAKHLTYLDEALTQSARNYIFTKDTVWHNRYLKATSEFNTALDSVSIIIGLKKNDKITLALYEAEKLAFEALHENNPDRAIALLSSSSYLKNGYAHGYCKSFHANGNLEQEGNYKKGLEHGVIKKYHKNGEIESEEQYQIGELNVCCKYYNERGVLLREGDFKKNKRNGTFTLKKVTLLQA